MNACRDSTTTDPSRLGIYPGHRNHHQGKPSKKIVGLTRRGSARRSAGTSSCPSSTGYTPQETLRQPSKQFSFSNCPQNLLQGHSSDEDRKDVTERQVDRCKDSLGFEVVLPPEGLWRHVDRGACAPGQRGGPHSLAASKVHRCQKALPQLLAL